MAGPPAATKAHQKLDDVAEADIARGGKLAAQRRRQHDLLKTRRRHGEDRDIAIVFGTIGGADPRASIARFDRTDGTPEMKTGAVPAAIITQIIDQCAVAADDARLRA